MLTATDAAAPSPALPEERRPCPEAARLPLLPHDPPLGWGGRLLCTSPLPEVEDGWGGGDHPWGTPEDRAAPRGGRRGSPAPGRFSPAGAEPTGVSFERGSPPSGRAAPVPPGPGGDLGSRGLAGAGSTHRALKRDPTFSFSAAGRPTGQRGDPRHCISHGSLQGAGGICQ